MQLITRSNNRSSIVLDENFMNSELRNHIPPMCVSCYSLLVLQCTYIAWSTQLLVLAGNSVSYGNECGKKVPFSDKNILKIRSFWPNGGLVFLKMVTGRGQ